jgi:hypothetical protein
MLSFPVVECWRKEVVNKCLRCLWKEVGGGRARRRGWKGQEQEAEGEDEATQHGRMRMRCDLW